jgi:hypothetical protein
MSWYKCPGKTLHREVRWYLQVFLEGNSSDSEGMYFQRHTAPLNHCELAQSGHPSWVLDVCPAGCQQQI